MATLTIKLPSQPEQTDFNLRRWNELIADPEVAKIEGRVETDRYGHVIMSLPPAANHGSYQSEIAYLLRSMMQTGRVLTECPISTADGVRAADVAWASPDCLKELGNHVCFPRSPEICIEVLSPSNSDAEIQEKTALYFDAGAKEVWLCETSGAMKFFVAANSAPVSKLCPDFPCKSNYADGGSGARNEFRHVFSGDSWRVNFFLYFIQEDVLVSGDEPIIVIEGGECSST